MLPQFAVAALNYWSWLDQWQSTNGMVSIFAAHNLVRSILVLVTYTLLTSGKIQTRNIYRFQFCLNSLIAARCASGKGSVPRNNVTEPLPLAHRAAINDSNGTESDVYFLFGSYHW